MQNDSSVSRLVNTPRPTPEYRSADIAHAMSQRSITERERVDEPAALVKERRVGAGAQPTGQLGGVARPGRYGVRSCGRHVNPDPGVAHPCAGGELSSRTVAEQPRH